MEPKATLVIAAYQKDLDWLDKIDNDELEIVLINKGRWTEHPKYKCITIPNIGVTDNSFIYYTSTYYDELREYTIFMQDFPFDHYEKALEFLNEKRYEKGFQPLADKRIYIAAGEDTQIFVEGLVNCNFIGVAFPCGAQYSVPKEYIHNKPKWFWENLRDKLPWYTHPFTAYFLERAWTYIYNPAHTAREDMLTTKFFNYKGE